MPHTTIATNPTLSRMEAYTVSQQRHMTAAAVERKIKARASGCIKVVVFMKPGPKERKASCRKKPDASTMGKMQEEADGVNLAHVPLMLKNTSWHCSEKRSKPRATRRVEPSWGTGKDNGGRREAHQPKRSTSRMKAVAFNEQGTEFEGCTTRAEEHKLVRP